MKKSMPLIVLTLISAHNSPMRAPMRFPPLKTSKNNHSFHIHTSCIPHTKVDDLYQNIKEGKLTDVQKLITENPKLLETNDLLKGTPAHTAIREHQPDILAYILKHTPSLRTSTDSAGRTPLSLARELHENFDNIVELLARRALYYCIATDVKEKFHRDIVTGNLGAVKAAVAADNHLPTTTDYHGRNAIHLAFLSNRLDMIAYFSHTWPELLNNKDNRGKTPLEYAREHEKKFESIIALLQEKRVP